MAKAARLGNNGELIEADDPQGYEDSTQPVDDTSSEPPSGPEIDEAPVDISTPDVGGDYGDGATAGNNGNHDPAPVSVGEPGVYTAEVPDLAPTVGGGVDPTAGFKRKIPLIGESSVDYYAEAPGGGGQTGALIEALLAALNGTA